MLGTDFGLAEPWPIVPALSSERLYYGQSFDIVFCDGEVLRTPGKHRDERREKLEARRLLCSQLILALQRNRQGGTLIVLMHKLESLHCIYTLCAV